MSNLKIMCRGKAYYRNRGHQHGHRARHWKAAWAWNTPPVNVKEQDDQYELFVYAAGYEKTDFQVQVNDHILVVKVEKKESDIVDSPNWRRQEFYANGVERRFELAGGSRHLEIVYVDEQACFAR